MRTWTVEYGGNEITIVNSFATAKLLVNGETQDIIWGTFVLNSLRFTGSLESGGNVRRIKAVLGARFFSPDCAIFVDDEMIFNSADT